MEKNQDPHPVTYQSDHKTTRERVNSLQQLFLVICTLPMASSPQHVERKRAHRASSPQHIELKRAYRASSPQHIEHKRAHRASSPHL
ncbi:hypothetical protein MTR_0028s0030 [Medicago truncatula]|uniref:Uncharacterized protein n=1 Tax=Medicago truncatula TaxID=3880 RepID=A0A072TUN0_MEDTR|nr:hypothetical protein MTR_0028s0030 [Medicago truncatula]